MCTARALPCLPTAQKPDMYLQAGLLDDLAHAFKVDKGIRYEDVPDSNHGRPENRRSNILPACNFLLEENRSARKDMSTLIKIEASREIKDVLHRETRYCISDETVGSPSCYLSPARGHRGIENRLHRHPDVTFREDAGRAREGNAPLNLSTLRKLTLQLLSSQKDKLRLKKRLYKADLDIGYLKKIINF
jgi:predicted transposase YbfD/YdcC